MSGTGQVVHMSCLGGCSRDTNAGMPRWPWIASGQSEQGPVPGVDIPQNDETVVVGKIGTGDSGRDLALIAVWWAGLLVGALVVPRYRPFYLY